jgi:hypothetical protein
VKNRFSNYRHPGEGGDLAAAFEREGETPAFAGVTKMIWVANV